jgi:hypothetical protein
MKISNKKPKNSGYRVLPKDNDSFFVRVNSNEGLVNLLVELKKLGVLGSRINYGTYLPDSYLVSDVISKNIYDNDFGDEKIFAVSISIDDNDYRKTHFGNLYGIHSMKVSLPTIYDYKVGDIYRFEVSYDDAINKTIKLLEYAKK